jgi:hypothetical protein
MNNIINNNNVEKKEGEIEMMINEPYIDYNNIDQDNNEHDNEDDNNSDNLSEFSEYKDNEFDGDDDYDYLENCFDFDFAFDIIFTPENNSELLQLTEIKSKIVNRIKLNALDLSHIKNLEDNDKFDLIKLFNHMV